MTSPRSKIRLDWISSAANTALIALVGVALVGAVLVGGLTGCEEKPAAKKVAVAPPPPPPPPPAPSKPPVTLIADLMAEYSIDERVVLLEEDAPDNDQDRIAVLTFFDAFARGDAETLGSMMSLLDRIELDAMVDAGEWKQAVEGIVQIDVETGPSPYGQDCALARFEVDADYQPQLWYYSATVDGSMFDAAPAPPRIIDQLYGDDWITVWHELLEEELMLANELDAEIEADQVNLNEGRSSGSSGSSARPQLPNPGSSPSSNPNGPHRRPKGKPRKPPGSR